MVQVLRGDGRHTGNVLTVPIHFALLIKGCKAGVRRASNKETLFLFPGRAGRSECAVSLVRWLALLLFIGLLTALTGVTDGRNIRRCALNYLPITAIEIGNELQFP